MPAKPKKKDGKATVLAFHYIIWMQACKALEDTGHDQAKMIDGGYLCSGV